MNHDDKMSDQDDDDNNFGFRPILPFSWSNKSSIKIHTKRLDELNTFLSFKKLSEIVPHPNKKRY